MVPKACNYSLAIKQVACGLEHTAILTGKNNIITNIVSGNIHTMGSNSDGKLGLGSKAANHSFSLKLVEALLGPMITEISCGDHHTVAVTSTGECYSWGQGI